MLTLKDAKTGLASKQDEENISKYKQVSKRFRGELKFRRNYQKERSKVRRKQFNQRFSLLLSKGNLHSTLVGDQVLHPPFEFWKFLKIKVLTS